VSQGLVPTLRRNPHRIGDVSSHCHRHRHRLILTCRSYVPTLLLSPTDTHFLSIIIHLKNPSLNIFTFAITAIYFCIIQKPVPYSLSRSTSFYLSMIYVRLSLPRRFGSSNSTLVRRISDSQISERCARCLLPL
jgi:hypothetical protein